MARELRKWLAATGAKTAYIELGSPWENRHCVSLNSMLRDEFLNGEIFYSMKELRILAERWRVHFNTIMPHSPLGYRSPVPAAWITEASQRYGTVESKDRFPLSHTPNCDDDFHFPPCVTLTILLVQKIGQAKRRFSSLFAAGVLSGVSKTAKE